jgi:hypothetical protein
MFWEILDMKLKNKSFIKSILALLIFFSFAVYITYPLLFHFGDYITGYGDELFIAWVQNWVIHSLSTNITSIFDGNIYYPYHNSLAYSDTFIVTGILSIIPRFFINQPVVPVNFTLFSSFVLLGWCSYLLSYKLTKDFLASLLSGTLVVFSPAVLDKIVHIQMLAIYWFYFAALFMILFLEARKTRYLMLAVLMFLLQAYNSIMPSYFIAIALTIITINFFLQKKKQAKQLITKKNIGIVILTFIALIPLLIPYYQVSKEFHYVRDIRDAIHFALQPEDFWFPNHANETRTTAYKTFPY